VAYDFGVKETMLRHLSTLATVTVVPASTPAAEVLALEPDGVFLSNGPGDPAALAGPTAAIADLHDARFTLDAAAPGADRPGLAVTLVFPAGGVPRPG
jgi:carbamoyl-phosphate synthase small subunit